MDRAETATVHRFWHASENFRLHTPRMTFDGERAAPCDRDAARRGKARAPTRGSSRVCRCVSFSSAAAASGRVPGGERHMHEAEVAGQVRTRA